MEQTTTTEPTFIGIDVSKDRLDVAIHPPGKVFVTSRDAAGLDELLTRLRPLVPELVALEATGRHPGRRRPGRCRGQRRPRESSSGVCPDRTNSTICRRNSGGQETLNFGISDTSVSSLGVSTKPGQPHPNGRSANAERPFCCSD